MSLDQRITCLVDALSDGATWWYLHAQSLQDKGQFFVDFMEPLLLVHLLQFSIYYHESFLKLEHFSVFAFDLLVNL
jgi:hypothetical protein